MNILSYDEIIKNGIEFEGDVCYSGEFGEQVYTKDWKDNGVPVEGILYEKYPKGSIAYYEFCKNGMPHGQCVNFYESGKVKSYCTMDTGTIDGEFVELFENGNVKIKEICKYGLVLFMQEFNEKGELIKEKKELSYTEKQIYERWKDYYEGNAN